MVEFKRFTTNTAIKIVMSFGYESTTSKIKMEDAVKMAESYPENTYLVKEDASGNAHISFMNTKECVATYEVEKVEDFEEENKNVTMTNKEEKIYKKFYDKMELEIEFSESLKAPSRPNIEREMKSVKNEHNRFEDMIISLYHFDLISSRDAETLNKKAIEKYMDVYNRFLEVLKKCID